MRILGILAVLFCLSLLTGLVVAVDPARVMVALGDIPPGHALAALLIVQIQIILSAVRWRFTAARLGHPIALPLAVREYYVGSLLNQILPGGMAGDAFRAYRNRGEDVGGWKRPATAVVLERLSGQLAFFLLTGVGLIAWPFLLADRLPQQFSTLVWVFLAIVLAVLGLGLALGKSRLSTVLQRLRPDLAAAFWSDGAFAVQAVLSATIVAGYVATFLIAASAVGTPLPAIAAVTAIPLCLITMLIPAGIGGWGTREAAAAALWPLFGFTSAQGFSASLLYGMLSLVGAAVPGLYLLARSFLAGRIARS
ncbi:MAG: lysylphosphatidylglycerol synthase transmembrane domain-containing protein [Allorhizobium sp.]